VQPTTTFDSIPAGKYLAMTTASKMKPSMVCTGSHRELVFTIPGGAHKGRQL